MAPKQSAGVGPVFYQKQWALDWKRVKIVSQPKLEKGTYGPEYQFDVAETDSSVGGQMSLWEKSRQFRFLTIHFGPQTNAWQGKEFELKAIPVGQDSEGKTKYGWDVGI